MTRQQTPKALHIALWATQILLAATFAWAGSIKLAQPVEQLAAMWPWAGQVPHTLVQFTGVIDLLGALGLILPALLRWKWWLTPLTALCIVLLMVCAGAFHVVRGEVAGSVPNIVFALMAAFIAWGRWKKAPIM